MSQSDNELEVEYNEMRVNYALKATAENHIDIGKALDKDSDDDNNTVGKFSMTQLNIQPLIEEGVGESHSKDLKEVCRRIKEKRTQRLGFTGIKAFQLFNFKSKQFEGKMLSLKKIIAIKQHENPELETDGSQGSLPKDYEYRKLYRVDLSLLPMFKNIENKEAE